CREPGGAERGVAEPGGAEPEGAEPGGTESGGAEPRGTVSAGGPTGASSRREPHSPPQLREWFTRRTRLRSGAAGAGGPAAGGIGAAGTIAAGPGGVGAAGPEGARAGGTGAAGAGGTACAGARDPGAGGAGAEGTGGAGAAGPRGARSGGTGAADAGGAAGTRGAGAAGAGGAVGAGAGDLVAGDLGAGGAGLGGAGVVGTGTEGTVRSRPFFVPLLRQVLSLPSSTGLTPPLLCPPPDQSQPQLKPDSPLLAPSPDTEHTDSLTKRRAPESCPASPVRAICTGRRVPRPRPPPVPCTHGMAIRPSSIPLRVPVPSPPASSLPDVPDPESDLVRVASLIFTRLLATVVTDPSFESTAASALVAELVEFAAACRLDYAASLIAQSEFVCPPSVGGQHACNPSLGSIGDHQWTSDTDILTPRSYAEAITGPYSSQWQTAMDAEMASWKSTGTYADVVPPRGANIVDGMWIFRMKQPLGSPPVFKAHYVARGFSQR
ncbi:unnamed protein product, partial [Closterium sp. NIES-54]